MNAEQAELPDLVAFSRGWGPSETGFAAQNRDKSACGKALAPGRPRPEVPAFERLAECGADAGDSVGSPTGAV